MAGKNTPLINTLLEQVGQHPEFEAWQQKGKHSSGAVKHMCESLRSDPRFIGQPGRFYTSAITMVNYIYKAWLASQQRLQRRLEGQTRWLEMLKSDTELVEASNCNLDTLRAKALEVLTQQTAQPDQPNSVTTQQIKGRKGKKPKDVITNRSLTSALFEAYGETEDILICSAICYLLKNGCKTGNEEDPDKFARRRRQVEIRVYRLQQQIASRLPKGRDLTTTKWLEMLAVASTTVPQDEVEAKSWQDSLLRKSSVLPFPIYYETNEDLTWFQNDKGRICVKFNGLSELTFEVYCDRRQLHWFRRFLEDQQTKRDSKSQHSSSLFTLRSGRIAWQEGKGKGEPWNVHHLTLYCTVDTRLWTAEGTEEVREQKATEIAEVLTRMKQKGELNEKQQAFVKREHSTLRKINNPFPRPSHPVYQGQSHIIVGVSFGLERPTTAAVVDASTSQVLTYRSVRQLLGDNYALLNCQRRAQQLNSHQRHQAQKQAAPNSFGESELGQYVDRLLAKAIVTLARVYQSGSIVLPRLGDIREIVQSEIQARAEQKCPNYLEGQKKYAKQYRQSIHQWSYGRLIENIQSQAAQAAIATEQGQQPLLGSPQEKARDLALFAYNSRIRVII